MELVQRYDAAEASPSGPIQLPEADVAAESPNGLAMVASVARYLGNTQNFASAVDSPGGVRCPFGSPADLGQIQRLSKTLATPLAETVLMSDALDPCPLTGSHTRFPVRRSHARPGCCSYTHLLLLLILLILRRHI